jgi:hypothetical protein
MFPLILYLPTAFAALGVLKAHDSKIAFADTRHIMLENRSSGSEETPG